MIPENPDDLHILAGEYVLGVLDETDASEVAGALATNIKLRRAVTFWEEQLHPLSELVSPAEPPPGTWEAIEARITKPIPKSAASRLWDNIALWRWSTAGFAAAAAASLALWIVMTPASGPSFVAVLHPPQQDQAGWVATAGRSGLVVRAVTAATPPTDRSFELWAIAPGSTRPRSLGVIPPTGELKLYQLPPDLRDGATLAISIEPIGGSPTQQPTGPVVFVGSVKVV
jgi:anti-sigma-K factor RskA